MLQTGRRAYMTDKAAVSGNTKVAVSEEVLQKQSKLRLKMLKAGGAKTPKMVVFSGESAKPSFQQWANC